MNVFGLIVNTVPDRRRDIIIKDPGINLLSSEMFSFQQDTGIGYAALGFSNLIVRPHNEFLVKKTLQ